MMTAMMNAMIRNMSVEEREEMMLKMMPDMMKRADRTLMMANAMAGMAKLVSLYALYDFVDGVRKDSELKEILGNGIKNLMSKIKEMMPSMMPMMIPVMQTVMPNMMPFMMSFMMPMMSGMMCDGDEGGCMMMDMVDENPLMQERMGNMMMQMCPQMAGKVIKTENSLEFINRMEQAVLTERGISR